MTQDNEPPIQVNLYTTPSNGIRGVITAYMTFKGRSKRCAHAYLKVAGEPELAVDIPRNLSLDEIGNLTKVLQQFATKVHALGMPDGRFEVAKTRKSDGIDSSPLASFSNTTPTTPAKHRPKAKGAPMARRVSGR